MSNNKQTVKLYTEEQVIQMIESSYLHGFERAHDYKDVKEHILKSVTTIELQSVTPIELPSDEEIKKYTPYPLGKGFYNPLYSNKWEEGAKWMRNKIQGGEQ